METLTRVAGTNHSRGRPNVTDRSWEVGEVRDEGGIHEVHRLDAADAEVLEIALQL